MKPPDTFADGFGWKTVIGAVCLGLFVLPGSMYLGLVVGPTTSFPAQWVIIILFAEVGRRSFKELKMQEVFVLYYMAGLTLSSPFTGLLWNQYLVQSEFAMAMGIAQEVPSWIAPSKDVIEAQGRTFFTKAWLAPILLVSTILIVHRVEEFGLGYVLYRITNDVEELPFPMAPVAASGITALVESKTDHVPWRWRCFSIGGILGMVWGLIYIGVPAISGVFLMQPLKLVPIPWVDFTENVRHILPATPFNISFDLTLVFVGMVIPFWAVIGGFIGVLVTMIANPMLYRHGILANWNPQMGVVDTIFSNSVDFYLSFGLGLTLAITLISLGQIVKPLMTSFTLRTGVKRPTDERRRHSRLAAGWRKLVTNNVRRGDFSIFLALGIYIGTTGFWIGLATWLIEGFPWYFFVFYAMFYTPLISYATAKLEGLAGQVVEIPMIREGAYILSGYQGVQIWFAPAPVTNYGIATVQFRILELTGTRIISKVKTLLVTLPIVIVASLLFSELLWRMAPIPSEAYPFTQQMWELQVKNVCLIYSSTSEGGSLFMEALNLDSFLWGLGIGVGTYSILLVLGLPILLIFGIVRGLGQSTPSGLLLEFIGAMVGRFYFRRRFGDMWLKYAPVLFAGFSCGVGLAAMVSVACTMLSKMMSPLIF